MYSLLSFFGFFCSKKKKLMEHVNKDVRYFVKCLFLFFVFFFFFVWKASRFVSNDLLQRNNMLLILAIKQDRWPPLYITSLYVVCCICIQTSTRTSITDELSNIFDPAELTDSTKKKKEEIKKKKSVCFVYTPCRKE